jgi:hypothetical protein
MKLERNYLTASEIKEIVDAMLEKESEYDRQIVKYGGVAQILGLVEMKEGMDCTDAYDILAESGIDLDAQISNLFLIDRIVREELGVAKTVGAILSGVIEQADEALKGIDPKAMLVELNNIKNGKTK